MPGDFDFRNLTPEMRSCMLREIQQDIADGVLVLSVADSICSCR
jgi:hypothetical protein